MTNVLEEQSCTSHEVRVMPRLFAVITCLFTIALISGCQCSPLTAKYADLIDDISDQPFRLDPLYIPALDVNRIGRPDWCQCPLNRLWCGYGCRNCCSRCQEGMGMPYQPSDMGPYQPSEMGPYQPGEMGPVEE